MIGERDGHIHAPDLIEPVIGFRTWSIRNGELTSPYIGKVVWNGSTLRAECLARWRPPFLWPKCKHESDAPAPECKCGIYAFYEPTEGVDDVLRLVHGAIVMWGRIEVHRDGMRGEYARPVALALSRLDSAHRSAEIRDLARRVGVDAVYAKDLQETALRCGRPMPRSLIPEHA